MEERRRIERKPRWNRRRRRRHRREDRRRENAAIAPCSRHSRNRAVRRRSQIDTTGKSSRSGFFFFRKMRFRQELGDDAKNCCGGRENGLSSLIGLPNGEIWRTSAFAISLPARRHFHIFEIAGLIRFRRRTRLTPSRRFYRMTARFVGNYSRYRVAFTCTYSNVVNFFMLTLILIN